MSAQVTSNANGYPAFAVDQDGLILRWNSAIEKMLGYPASTALGQRCWRLLAGQDTYGNQYCYRQCSLRRMAFERRPVNGCQLCVRTAFNGRQQCAIESRLITDAAGNDLLLHTCRPESAVRKNGNGKHATNGFAANGQQSAPLHRANEIAVLLAGDQPAAQPDDGRFRLGMSSLLEIGDLLEQWFSEKLNEKSRAECGLDGKETGFMEKLERVLDRNHADPQFGLPEIAAEMYMSTRQLQRKLKDATGHNPAEFLRCYRLKRARELLKTGTQVGLAADAVGFSSPAYFASCFKAQFGQTPSDYQQRFH